jgi:glycosyltransferase involved in cell wall biosynthesis
MRVSFVIPAHNEAVLLPRTIQAMRNVGEALSLGAEIVVADDASEDATGEIAASMGARVVRVENRQIAATRNAGAGAATGDLLIFVDADTMVTEGAVRGALAAVEAGAAYGGARVECDGWIPGWSRVALRVVQALYRLLGLASGAFLFVRSDVFEASGGFDQTLYAGEEADLSRRLRRLGRYAWVREPVITSGRKLRTHSARELLVEILRLAIGGRRRVARREHLDLWYGPRRADPDPEVGDAAMRRSSD